MSREEDRTADDGELIPAEPGTEEERSLRGQDAQESIYQQIIELERGRIDRDNRRTEIVAKEQELNDEKDKRQFEFASEGQRLEAEAERRRFLYGWSFAAITLIVVVVAVGLVLYIYGILW